MSSRFAEIDTRFVRHRHEGGCFSRSRFEREVLALQHVAWFLNGSILIGLESAHLLLEGRIRIERVPLAQTRDLLKELRT
jgi:hypothetical protein